MSLLVITTAVALLCHGVASYEHAGYSVHDDHGGYGEHDGGGGKGFHPKLEVIHGPHETIEVKGYSAKLEPLGQHVEIPEPPIKVIRVTKTVAIKVPVPYPVKIKEKVPYPVHIHKPYPVPVPQIIKVPHLVPAPHAKQPDLYSVHKKEHVAPVWPSKDIEQSEESNEGDDATAKVSHEYGGGGGGGYSAGGRDTGSSYGAHLSSFGGGGDEGQHGDYGQHGGYSHDAGSGAGVSFGLPQHQSYGGESALGGLGGYHSAAPSYGHESGGHYDDGAYGGGHASGGGGDSYSAPQPNSYNSFQPESNSYDTAIQEYLQKLKLPASAHGGGGGEGAGLYAGSYSPLNSLDASGGGAGGADDYHHVRELETTKVDRVSYGH